MNHCMSMLIIIVIILYIFQLKNMINALFSSQAHGTKDFECNDIQFGWEDIKVCTYMYAHSCILLKLLSLWTLC